ncbi:trypsin-like peptidase domain-containing protein [Amycolatopsis sp. BJA-103]|uniref:trypsin-like peptidase domain-containing protein n=2 Tax=unclassified Amycolatopsis TaxID=2618356 RepID=UPI000C7881F3|nr:trypsin-like peptidase domain-containing protein [Amycolatopsis sp. BJA-103]AUI58428.1 hypothetical protein BKN51_09510 [Amycolatopsis sp. BJA-103]PNE15106.1 hypothetical protein B1H26_31495 [Amycolatopsis sp. BJA-103]
MAAQAKTKAVANTVRQAIATSRATGFTSIELRGTSIELSYKGPVPDAVQTAIAQARRTGPVIIKAARYSLAELETAMARITGKLRTQPGGPAHSIEITPDGQGLVVGVDRATTASALDLPQVSIPVQIAHRERLTPYVGRHNDAPPYWGGAEIVNTDVSAGCSSGFGVRNGGQRYLLTAGHCGRPGGGWENGDRSRFVGNATHEHVEHDLLLIATDAGGRIYDGGVGTGEFSKGVSGWAWVIGGEELCSSGAVSGAICGHVVEAFGKVLCGYDPYGNYECYSGLVQSRHRTGAIAGRPGDSGGPVFSLDGTDRVVAKGTITGGQINGPILLWQQFGTAVADLGITPVTS